MTSKSITSSTTYIPLEQRESELHWWRAVHFLDENDDVQVCAVSSNSESRGWTWYLVRTMTKYVYLQNTYFKYELMRSVPISTNSEGRDEYIKSHVILPK